MKILDIALKDMLRSLRSAVALVFMFLLPLLTTGILYFAFGGLGGEEGGFDLPLTHVQVVNLDQPVQQMGDFSAGRFLVEFLQDERFAELLTVTVADDEASARAAVDNQEAGVAVIIPTGFTTAALAMEGSTAITLYQDPTLTLGPAIVKGIIDQFVDGFSGTMITANVVAHQLDVQGLTVDATTMQQVTGEYVAWTQALGQSYQEGGLAALDIQAPPSMTQRSDFRTEMMTVVMTGMLIFYAFFTGASTAQTIIQEDEGGTLARLFVTPTSQAAILGGKFVAVFVTLIVQVVVLMGLSALIFGIHWGDPANLATAAVSLVIVAAGFGVFLMSFIKTTRQAGPVMGVVLTMTGMAGGLMTTGFTDTPAAFNTITLFTPQGWVLRTWKAAIAGGSTSELLLPATVTAGIGAILFVAGVLLFRKRFT
jgi:ABC-2 type transport system permease protein